MSIFSVAVFMQYKTKEDVMKKAKEAINIPFGIMDKYNRLSNNKGAIGQVIEESHFIYSINNLSEPDFKEAGVELKVTPYMKNKNGSISAKERMVLNIIDYIKETNNSFENSSFWNKNKCIQMMFYQYFKEKSKSDFFISNTIQFSYPKEDLKIITEDYEKIMFKIRNGIANEISEADTMYLSACTKGESSKTLRKQPFSSILAKQRAYSLKQSYITQILRQYVFGEKESEKIIKDYNILDVFLFETYVLEKLKPHFSKKQTQLIKELGIKILNSKAINELIITKLLEVSGKLSNTEEFKKANIVPKFIRINKNGTSIKENMSFPTFKFKEIVKENFENSDIYKIFAQTKYLFIIFKYNENDELIFKDIKFWNMPYNDILEVEKVFNRTVDIINKGVIINIDSKGRTRNNLPKTTENSVCHIRPHARNSMDTYELPDGRKLTKQCFWLNNKYILDQIIH